MRLSAIVPTHNRPVALRRCLETLQAQDVAPSSLEVLVVDDGSPPEAAIPALVEDVSRAGPVPMRCESLALTGLNGARNHGAAHASGEVLAFIDDDTLVSPGWAGALIRTFANHACAAVGGKVELELAGPAPEWLASRRYYLAEYDLGPEPRWLTGELIDGRDPFPVGANCAVRRSDFEALGGFLTGLDRIGGSLISNGDTEFFRRLHATGRTLRYEPEARLVHCVPADRLTVRFFAKRHYAQGYSDQLLRNLGGERPSWHQRRYHVRRIGRGCKRLAKDILRGRGTVNGRFEIDYWVGRLAAAGRVQNRSAC
jgi:glycosyltransferase involved in cell wall biosynthesis